MRIGADLTAETQTAFSERNKIASGQPHARRDARQNQIKNGGLGVHDASGQTHHRTVVRVVAQKEHGAREHRRAVGDDIRAALFDRTRRGIVRIDAHAARAQDHIDRLVFHLLDGRRNVLYAVLDQNVLGHSDAECSQLSFYNRRKAVRNTALCDLAAGSDNGCCFQRKRADFQNRRAARRLLSLP